MIVTYKDFPRLTFPLYILPSDNWHVQDGVVFVDSQVLDERKLPGKTLGIRRLQCGRKDLLPLKKALLNISDLVSCRNKIFVDNSGYYFTYLKTKHLKLKSYRIKKIEPKEVKSLLWVYNWPTPFTIDRPPAGDPSYVRFLEYEGAPWIIYDYSRESKKTTYRRV